MEPAADIFQTAIDKVFRVKLGFAEDADVGDDVWLALEPLMRNGRTDWTVFFRQLTYVMKEFPDLDSTDYAGMMVVLEADDNIRAGSSPFYEMLDPTTREEWIRWIEQWRLALKGCGDSGESFVYERMRTNNPKYVLREWMLVDAYTSAAKGEEAELFILYALVQRPYEEGSTFEEEKYYRRAPPEALEIGGTAFMSCSS
jgi:uncharacterized protein YdiU (UPF0061 family)